MPTWSAVAARHEKDAEGALQRGDKPAARNAFLQAKSYYSLARFPSPYRGGSAICPPTVSKIKEESYNKYLECFRRAAELLQDHVSLFRVHDRQLAHQHVGTSRGCAH